METHLLPIIKPLLNYSTGTTIFSEGEPVKGIYQIYSGKIKVVASFDGKKEHIVRLATTEQLLGHRGLGGNMIYPREGSCS